MWHTCQLLHVVSTLFTFSTICPYILQLGSTIFKAFTICKESPSRMICCRLHSWLNSVACNALFAYATTSFCTIEKNWLVAVYTRPAESITMMSTPICLSVVSMAASQLILKISLGGGLHWIFPLPPYFPPVASLFHWPLDTLLDKQLLGSESLDDQKSPHGPLYFFWIRFSLRFSH